MKKNLAIFFFLYAAVCLTGCETVKGVGRDITNTSDAVQKAITKK